MRPLWQLHVEPPDLEEKTASGLYKAVEDHYTIGNREEANENRPDFATVLATPINGFMAMAESGDLYPIDAMDNGFPHPITGAMCASRKWVRERKPWRMPQPGDKVCFGFLDWNWEREKAYMFPDDIHFVFPADGTEPWAMGDWCLMDEIIEAPTTESGIVVSHVAVKSLGRGIARHFGDGFKERFPSIRPGDVVVYSVFGEGNTVCPDPFGGRDMIRIRPSEVVAIDRAGESDQRQKERLAELDEIARVAPRRFAQPLDMESGKPQEHREGIEKRAKKEWDRKYYAKRIEH